MSYYKNELYLSIHIELFYCHCIYNLQVQNNKIYIFIIIVLCIFRLHISYYKIVIMCIDIFSLVNPHYIHKSFNYCMIQYIKLELLKFQFLHLI